ncbi:restriction endonuclease [Rhodohalobacter sp. 614A]|uniref:restriction endonuclease n=1 Tax=Rhodohalobacter sp. 614A TaxID=2908649 RepID=UPI001F25EA5B|nr:restriction endonuclease [Rhodohalobacter sp. 614A]
MPKKVKSKAEKYWREFEELSVELIKEQFKMEPTLLHLTPAKGDGGYDAAAHFQLGNENSLDLTFKVLLEAKLSSTKKKIGLRTFAATLVIAHSNAAGALIITSNQLFSPQAFREVARFAQATHMQVRLIDGIAMATWVKNEYHRLESMGFSQELLNWVTISQNKSEKQRTFQLDLYANTNSRIKAELSIGTNKNGSLLPCEIIISEESVDLEPIIGQKRQLFVEDLIQCISSEAGIAVLEGGSGVGKSFLLSHAINSLTDSKRIASIDMSFMSTVNQLFFTVFEQITSIDLRLINSTYSKNKKSIIKILEMAIGAHQSYDIVEAFS